ncbi:unnamed protein product, partial [Sphagnum troendelagicum]
MGGIGKTTLAQKIYHLFHKDYEKFSFLEDVKSKAMDLVQRRLLHDLCGQIKPNSEDVNDYDLKCITNCMMSKKVLVVVDDVGTKENLKALLQVLVVKGGEKESKVIITCQNWQILKLEGVSEDGKVDMALLNVEQARELFSYHVFRGLSKPIHKGFENIFEKIVKACAGLPLSLEMMGGFLHAHMHLKVDDQLLIWEEALQKLNNMEPLYGDKNDRLYNTLEFCYSALAEPERNMFLDIACFFSGFKQKTIIRIWGNEGRHARHEDRHPQHDSCKIFEKIESMPNLRLLEMVEVSSNTTECVIKPQYTDDLQWLRFQNHVIQELPNALNQVNCFQLRVLHLANCFELKTLSPFIENLVALLELDLSECTQLTEIPTSIGQLIDLQHLDLSRCLKLEKLPTSIGELVYLQHLKLSGCLELKELPTSIGQLIVLQHLDLSGCSKLEKLPISIGQLIALQHLDLSKCLKLEE